MLNKLNYCFVVFFFGFLMSKGQECPKITFHYSKVPFDRSCSRLTDFKIEEAWINELYAKKDVFVDLWESKGPRLLKTAVKRVNRPFLKKELHATMTLCSFGSMSHPLLISMRQYLNSATEDSPKKPYQFVGTLFHEVLHIYVFDALKNVENVPMLEKYKEEPNSVRNHLHLMALLKYSYLELGWEEQLNGIIQRDTNAGGIYSRAWEIVNTIEGYEVFLDELISK